MIVGVEMTTDQRHPDVKIVRLRNEPHARRWLDVDPGFAWLGAADETLPASQQNWHRRVRYAFEVPRGFRLKAFGLAPHRRHHGESLVDFIRRRAVRRLVAQSDDGR